MLKRLAICSVIVLCATIARAQTYPSCPNGSFTSCTLTIHITGSATPIFAALASRQYLFLENTGYAFSTSVPALIQTPVFCSIGSKNQPMVYSAGASNVLVIQPGGAYSPPQIVKPQNAFTVPSGDISCIAPLGDVWLAVEQE